MLDIRVGSWVGPFKVVAPLEEAARAGMATLFVAQLTRLESTQLVVLKIIPVEDEGYDERGALRLNALRKEVEILQKLRHPNIVKIYPIPSRNGRRQHYIARAPNVLGNPWFCAMEHLGGGSLESRLRELTVLPLGEAVEIACQIGSALDYMHTKGYVHWDVKPDNILFRYDLYQDGIVEAVLTDFGIARRTHEPAVVAGTVRYMSPERLRVHMGEIPPDRIMDQRPADVYALGLVLYEMLAGNLPFVAEDEEGIKYAVLEEPPIPLSDFNYEVPPVVEDIIFQALEKNPAKRPTMEEMVTMLDRAVPAPRVIQPPLGLAAAPGVAPAVARPVRPRPAEVVERPERRPSPLQRLQSWALIGIAAALVFVGGTWVARNWGIISTATPTPGVVVASLEPSATPTHTPLPTYTPAATATPLPTYTRLPTYTPAPTATPEPTETPSPTSTLRPSPIATPTPVPLPPEITGFSPDSATHSTPVEVTVKGDHLGQATTALLIRESDGFAVSAIGIRVITDSEIRCNFDLPAVPYTDKWKLRVEGPGGGDEQGDFYVVKEKPPDDDKKKEKKEGK